MLRCPVQHARFTRAEKRDASCQHAAYQVERSLASLDRWATPDFPCRLKMVMGSLCGCARRFTKPKGVNPDYDDPVILSAEHTTVEDFCNRIHKDILKQFKK